MSSDRPIPRYLGILVLLSMVGFAAVGFYTIRRDVENLRVISQDNTQWSASQMEIELLRFRMSLASLRINPTPEALEEMHERFDILWSRVFMMGQIVRQEVKKKSATYTFPSKVSLVIVLLSWSTKVKGAMV